MITEGERWRGGREKNMTFKSNHMGFRKKRSWEASETKDEMAQPVPECGRHNKAVMLHFLPL